MNESQARAEGEGGGESLLRLPSVRTAGSGGWRREEDRKETRRENSSSSSSSAAGFSSVIERGVGRGGGADIIGHADEREGVRPH